MPHKSVLRLEKTILRMAGTVRSGGLGAGRRRTRRWWVLALGEHCPSSGFERREHARRILAEKVEGLGIGLDEYVWVWDETERIQLVVASVENKGVAIELASRLRPKGLEVRVVPEMEKTDEERGPDVSPSENED